MNDQNYNNGYRPPVDIFPGDGNHGSYMQPDLRAAFRSGMFLAMCILVTIATIFGSVSLSTTSGVSINYNFNVIYLLITIGMWMTYATACDPNAEPMKPTGFTMVSGCMKAQRILMWVAMGLLIFAGVVLIAIGAAMMANAELAAELADAINVNISDELWELYGPQLGEMLEYFEELITNGFLALLFIGLGVGVLLAAVIILILNLTFYRSCHRLAYSIAEYAKGKTTELVGARTVANWLIVMGIFSAVGGSVVSAALLIVASVFIRMNFIAPAVR